MSVASVLIGFQASRPDGRGVTTEEFLTPLKIRADEVEATGADGGAWASGMVYFSLSCLPHVGDMPSRYTSSPTTYRPPKCWQRELQSWPDLNATPDIRSSAPLTSAQ
jgi:hypothetical protein